MANKLSEEEFQRYFTPPMRLIGDDEESSGINIREFVLEALRNEGIEINIKELDIPRWLKSSSQIPTPFSV